MTESAAIVSDPLRLPIVAEKRDTGGLIIQPRQPIRRLVGIRTDAIDRIRQRPRATRRLQVRDGLAIGPRHACGFLGRIEITSEQNHAASLTYITADSDTLADMNPAVIPKIAAEVAGQCPY